MSKARFLSEAMTFFDPMLSLDREHEDWYVERQDDPLEEMKTCLLNNRTDTKVLFSGHRGSGKSSLLKKLARDPEITSKLFVVNFSIKDALNVADLAYTDLLIAIGHQLFLAADEQQMIDLALLKDLDQWSADITVIRHRTSEAQAEVKARIKAWFLDATGVLRTGFAEKQEFRQTLEPRVPQLIHYVNQIIRTVETKLAGGREVLLVVDDLNKPNVDVVLDLFYEKGPIVTQPECKIVFTVPIALLYSGQYHLVKENFSASFALPNVKIKDKDGRRNDTHWKTMKEVILRRLDRALIEEDALDLAVESSGGVMRELVQIIQGACNKALVAKRNSINRSHVEEAVGHIRAEYSYSLTREEDIEILKRIHQTGLLRYADERPLLRLLDNLSIISYPDNPAWYDVNPIVLDILH